MKKTSIFSFLICLLFSCCSIKKKIDTNQENITKPYQEWNSDIKRYIIDNKRKRVEQLLIALDTCVEKSFRYNKNASVFLEIDDYDDIRLTLVEIVNDKGLIYSFKSIEDYSVVIERVDVDLKELSFVDTVKIHSLDSYSDTNFENPGNIQYWYFDLGTTKTVFEKSTSLRTIANISGELNALHRTKPKTETIYCKEIFYGVLKLI